MQQKCIYCEAEITIDEEAWSLGEPQNKCQACREDPRRVMEYIRQRGEFKAVFEERAEGSEADP
jgi:hypothetical protein